MDETKRQLVRGWLVKAQHDLATADKLAAGPDPYLDTAIYHTQQAAVVHHSDAILLSFFGRPSVDSRNCGVALILNPEGVVSRSPGCNPG